MLFPWAFPGSFAQSRAMRTHPSQQWQGMTSRTAWARSSCQPWSDHASQPDSSTTSGWGPRSWPPCSPPQLRSRSTVSLAVNISPKCWYTKFSTAIESIDVIMVMLMLDKRSWNSRSNRWSRSSQTVSAMSMSLRCLTFQSSVNSNKSRMATASAHLDAASAKPRTLVNPGLA